MPTPAPSETEIQTEITIAPLLALFDPGDLPDMRVLQSLAHRVGLWSLVQDAGHLAEVHGYGRFRVTIRKERWAAVTDDRWHLELDHGPEHPADPSAIAVVDHSTGSGAMKQALLIWSDEQAVAPVTDDLPHGFRQAVLGQWLDPRSVEALRPAILGAAAVALWRNQAAHEGEKLPEIGERRRRPRA